MKSRKIIRPLSFKYKEYYRILFDDEHMPVELDKNRVDKVLSDFLIHLKEVQEDIDNIYSIDYELYRLLFKETYNALEVDDGKSWRLNDVIYNVEEAMKGLAENADDILSSEDSVRLSDLGFKDAWLDGMLFQKILEDTDEREVAEEVIATEEPIRRMRTIEWEISPGCKSSKNITYEELPMTDEIRKAVENEIQSRQ